MCVCDVLTGFHIVRGHAPQTLTFKNKVLVFVSCVEITKSEVQDFRWSE